MLCNFCRGMTLVPMRITSLYRPVEARRGLIGIPHRVGRPHLEIVTPQRQTVVRRRTRTARKTGAINIALKSASRLICRERRAGASRHRPRICRDVGVGRRGIDVPRVEHYRAHISRRVELSAIAEAVELKNYSSTSSAYLWMKRRIHKEEKVRRPAKHVEEVLTSQKQT